MSSGARLPVHIAASGTFKMPPPTIRCHLDIWRECTGVTWTSGGNTNTAVLLRQEGSINCRPALRRPHARDTEQIHALPGEDDATQQTEVAWSEHGSPGASTSEKGAM